MQFPICLADNGTEFSDPCGIEVDSDGVIRSRVFYCDPSSPGQKGACENNHEFMTIESTLCELSIVMNQKKTKIR